MSSRTTEITLVATVFALGLILCFTTGLTDEYLLLSR